MAPPKEADQGAEMKERSLLLLPALVLLALTLRPGDRGAPPQRPLRTLEPAASE